MRKSSWMFYLLITVCLILCIGGTAVADTSSDAKNLTAPFYWEALQEDYNLTAIDFYEIGNKGCETLTAALMLDLMETDENLSLSFKLDSYVVKNKDTIFIYAQDGTDCYCIGITKDGKCEYSVLEHSSNDILKDFISSIHQDYYLNDAETLMDAVPFLYMKYAY